MYFAENSLEVLQAYADSGEGVDRAGGFAIQVRNILFRTKGASNDKFVHRA